MASNNEAIGYQEALGRVLGCISPIGSGPARIGECAGRVASEDLYARVDSPSVDASLKDGYAVRSQEILKASPENPVRLRVIGTAAAGLPAGQTVAVGDAVRILTGARIPNGADSVVAEEYVRTDGENVVVAGTVGPGRNIFSKGADVAIGERVCGRGDRLTPGVLGILAAAGFGEVPVYSRPSVGIIATGDEVVAPGRPLPEGKLYASNLVTLDAWCRRFGMETLLRVVRDEKAALRECLEVAIESCDAILTSGGAWTGERDLVAKILGEIGWKKSFHRIRIGPGKAVGFGMLGEKPVFILPGGPPSNLTAFLEIALPGLLKLCGYADPQLPRISVTLDRDIAVRDREWTQFVFGSIDIESGPMRFSPLELKSRLQSMARAEAVVCVPEGVDGFLKGDVVQAQLLG